MVLMSLTLRRPLASMLPASLTGVARAPSTSMAAKLQPNDAARRIYEEKLWSELR
jgi:hypothetical protein